MPTPTQEELRRRKIVNITQETVENAASTDYPGHWPGENHAWDLDLFKENLEIQFHANEPNDLSFSLIGVDTSVANAFRRIMIAEIPTLAIETVFSTQNTSIIVDEVLSHRLGLIPLRGDRNALMNLKWYRRPDPDDPASAESPESQYFDYNVCRMALKAKCTWKEGGKQLAAKGETDPEKLYNNHTIYAKDLKFLPYGAQEQNWDPNDPLRAIHPDMLIVKMRPGQEIDMLMYCWKGVGADHAKFSPVATASYRLLPTIDILKPIIGADAKKFAKCFPRGVIDLKPVTAAEAMENPDLHGKEGENKAVVKNAFRDTVSRECLRHAEFKDKVKLGRVRDHFIFRVESTGQWDSDQLFLESVKLLKVKCEKMKRGLNGMMR
ncbi:DNA-directed RNA polymeras-like proteines I and III subunit RPAC1 [Polyplosphaeria fusca]|uniref:DNA-directed RNA polymerases I and III subunit RPAC1 n=1 Tax=Polyplosphaeria fusca TaxID=682080 RepID=A0A9P4V5P9_9PLEO|nr:DNA-directed RNA polymeras-like proteines I and III subunit RPAC1 [Polyplosphaeria fusca]